MSDRIGVLLLNLGGPDSLDAIQPFLKRLFSDRSIIRISPFPFLQRWIAGRISRKRARTVRHRYELIGGKSPIADLTAAQAEALEKDLNRYDREYLTAVAMRYWNPTTEEAIDAMLRANVKQLVALPLYPQYSAVTTGSHFALLDKIIRRRAPGMQLIKLKDFHDDGGYLDALAATVREAIEKLPAHVRGGAQVLFSAHSIPQKFADAGDPYIRQTEAAVAAVVERLGIPENRWTLAYQSRSGPVAWVRPDTETVLRAVAAGGGRAVVMVPVSFVSDHIETLWEMDIYFRGVAEECGAVFVRAPALNTRADFIAALAGIVKRAAGGKE